MSHSQEAERKRTVGARTERLESHHSDTLSGQNRFQTDAVLAAFLRDGKYFLQSFSQKGPCDRWLGDDCRLGVDLPPGGLGNECVGYTSRLWSWWRGATRDFNFPATNRC